MSTKVVINKITYQVPVEVEETLTALGNEIEQLKDVLDKYAWHKKDCMLFSIAEHPHCSCGYEQAVKGK